MTDSTPSLVHDCSLGLYSKSHKLSMNLHDAVALVLASHCTDSGACWLRESCLPGGSDCWGKSRPLPRAQAASAPRGPCLPAPPTRWMHRVFWTMIMNAMMEDEYCRCFLHWSIWRELVLPFVDCFLRRYFSPLALMCSPGKILTPFQRQFMWFPHIHVVDKSRLVELPTSNIWRCLSPPGTSVYILLVCEFTYSFK